MLKKKQKKMVGMRGSKTHGGGAMKKRRGAGNRGGKGLSGSGKRGDAKNQKILKKYGKKYHGKNGFNSQKKKKINILSIKYLEDNFEFLVEDKLIEKKDDEFIFDSVKHGFDKILGRTNLTHKITVIAKQISKGAEDKIKEANGKVVLFSSKKD
jgi:large subunit ribosomal protein L15